MAYLKDGITIVIGLILAFIIASAISALISSLAFAAATGIYGNYIERNFTEQLADKALNSINIGAEVKGLEVKEPHGYEHFRVEHQRDLLLEVSNE